MLSFSPRGKVIPLLTIHLIPSLFLFRTSLITHTASPISIIALVVELVYFFALICIPYQDPLDRLLCGAHSKGGGNSGSDVPLPKHYEEPICMFPSRPGITELTNSRLVKGDIRIHHTLPCQTLLQRHQAGRSTSDKGG